MEAPRPLPIEEGSSRSRTQCESSTDQTERDGVVSVPTPRRSTRLLAKQKEREAFILATQDCVDTHTPVPSKRKEGRNHKTTGDEDTQSAPDSASVIDCEDLSDSKPSTGRSRKRQRSPGGDKAALKKSTLEKPSTSKQSLSSTVQSLLIESDDDSPVRSKVKTKSSVKSSPVKSVSDCSEKATSGKRTRINPSLAATISVPPAKRLKASNPLTNSPKSKRQKRNSENLQGKHREKGKESSDRDSSEDQSKLRSRKRGSTRKTVGSSQSESDSSPLRKATSRKTFRERKKRSELATKDQSPKGKGRKSNSLKGKGKASSSFIRTTSSGFCSLPSLPDFIKITNMDSDSNGDQTIPQGRAGDQSGGAEGATASSSSAGGGGGGVEGESNPLEPFAGSSEDNRRLQAMLEARGLPPHLLGALGSKMHYILQKSMSSSMSSTNNSRAQQLLAGVSSLEDEGLQLQSCIELGQLLVMGNEDTLSGFPVKQAVPALINLLSMEHNFDMMLNACRSLTYMMEALPRSTVVVASAIPILIGRLQVIQCMDVAEQALSALDLLSKRHGKDILQAGGLNACLLYLDFFSIATQRCALSVAANCCQSVSEEDFGLVADAVPILTNRLQHQDKRSVESCCLCFSRLVDNFASKPKLLKDIASQGLLQNLQQLLVVSPPVISSSIFVTVVRMLSNLSASCPSLAVQLLRTNMADTLRYLLVGSGEITLENIELMIRPPSEVYEILSLTSELMPPLPKDGIFAVEEIMAVKTLAHSATQWEWQDGNNVWRPYGRMENRVIENAHQANEEECCVDVVGNSYIVDLAAMQQFNEETGTTRAVRRSSAEQKQQDTASEEETEADARLVALREDPSIGTSFVQALFAALYEVFNSMAGHAVRTKCLTTILRLLYHAEADVLVDILRDIPVSSQIATMLKAPEYKIVVGAMQMADILMSKLPQVFSVYFHREGVIHQIKNLKDTPLKNLATPTKEMTTPISAPTAANIESPQTPNSTRKRLSDIFRKGRRQLRKLGRARSDDQEQPPRSQTPHISSPANEGKVPLLPPSQAGSMPVSTIVGGASRAAAMFEEAGGSGESASLKGRVQQWIQEQSAEFLDRWVKSSKHHPELDVVKKLAAATKELDLRLPTCTTALSSVCGILTDPASNVSAFELMHCSLHEKLLVFLTADCSECPFTLNARLRQFLHIFMRLPEQDAFATDWSPPPQLGLMVLMQKLLGCVDQLEQFPVRVHDMPGRRGSQALRFFNTHQIKCVLERHPSVTGGTSQWKGGPLRIDPLATVQTLERYMVVRGFGRQDHGNHFDDFESEESEIEDGNFHGLPGVLGGNLTEHRLEFLIGDRVLPYSMSVFQAIKQFAVQHNHEGEEEFMPLGRPEIWIRSHTIYYRAVQPGRSIEAGPSGATGTTPRVLSTSLPATPLFITAAPSSGKKHAWSTSTSSTSGGGGGGSLRRRVGSGKLPASNVPPTTPSGPVTRLMRSQSSREKPQASPPSSSSSSTHPLTARSSRSFTAGSSSGVLPSHLSSAAHKEKEKVALVRRSPLHQELQQSVALSLVGAEDPSLPILRLLKVLYALNTHWTDLYPGLAGSPVITVTEFVNNKLTAKTTRQLQDPLNVMTGNFPPWIHQLSTQCPFLFPFECRQTLFFITTFDRDRALARLQEQQPELSSSDGSGNPQTVTPRFDKKKGCVSRENLLQQAERLINETAGSKALLEVHYENEVGTGLGPTLEFYALVSRELQRSELMLWRGDPCPIPGAPQGASSSPLYVNSPVGLFPAPLGPGTKFSRVEEVCSKFHFLGKLMAKSIADSRMLDIPLSEAFYKWMLGLEGTFTAQDLQYVDPVVARSFAQVAAVAVKKHSLENDHLLSPKALAVGIESLTLDGGGSIEDLDLDFTLPGYPDIELKPGGRDVPVTVHNLDDYLKLVVDWTLLRGVARQIEAFKEGFNLVFPVAKLRGLFYPSEMDMLICGAHLQKWDIKELMECCRPDHGYSHDSHAVQYLFEVLSTYDTAEQRQFIQFVTGSPRLPVGGFKALSPTLTIVRKTVESSRSPDSFLPSVMTCVNYLKLPDYSSVEVMREKLYFALREGRNSFHLS